MAVGSLSGWRSPEKRHQPLLDASLRPPPKTDLEIQCPKSEAGWAVCRLGKYPCSCEAKKGGPKIVRSYFITNPAPDFVGCKSVRVARGQSVQYIEYSAFTAIKQGTD